MSKHRRKPRRRQPFAGFQWPRRRTGKRTNRPRYRTKSRHHDGNESNNPLHPMHEFCFANEAHIAAVGKLATPDEISSQNWRMLMTLPAAGWFFADSPLQMRVLYRLRKLGFVVQGHAVGTWRRTATGTAALESKHAKK